MRAFHKCRDHALLGVLGLDCPQAHLMVLKGCGGEGRGDFYRKFIIWVFLSFADRPGIFEALDLIHPVETVMEIVRYLTWKQSFSLETQG